MKSNFRIWGELEKCYLTGLPLESETSLIKLRSDGNLEIESKNYQQILDQNQYILEWSLNRKDKFGHEIFQGDIIDTERSDNRFNRYVVSFGPIKRKMDTGYEVEIIGFYFNPPYVKEDGFFSISNNWKGGVDYDVMQIIGNIHENSELI